MDIAHIIPIIISNLVIAIYLKITSRVNGWRFESWDTSHWFLAISVLRGVFDILSALIDLCMR